MPVTFVPSLSSQDRTMLGAILEVEPAQLDARLEKLAVAAVEEYTELFLGRKVFTRGSDIREYRLYLLIRHVFVNTLPNETQISAMFQTTTSQSRALLRAVASKYQYDLAAVHEATLKGAVDRFVAPQSGSGETDGHFEEQSEYVVEAINALIGQLDGTLTRLIRSQGAASSYVVKPATRKRLREHFQLALP